MHTKQEQHHRHLVGPAWPGAILIDQHHSWRLRSCRRRYQERAGKGPERYRSFTVFKDQIILTLLSLKPTYPFGDGAEDSMG